MIFVLVEMVNTPRHPLFLESKVSKKYDLIVMGIYLFACECLEMSLKLDVQITQLIYLSL